LSEWGLSGFEGFFFNPDSSIEPTNRGDFHSGELTHKASLCVPPIDVV